MKIAFIGPYRDGTGYANAAIEYILSLDAAGITIAPRPVKMTNTTGAVPDRIKELEGNDLCGVDAVFQFNLPDQFSYKGGVLNVGGFAYETDRLPNNWDQHLKLMDKLIVPCNHQASVCDFHPDVSVVPYSVDVNKFTKSYTKMDFGLPRDCFKFYTISEYTKRKNIPALIAAYFSRFSSDDNVVLVIKTHTPGRNAEDAASLVKQVINDMKAGLGRFKNPERYPKVVLLTKYMTEDQLLGLHQSCDTFLSASHGEAWCLPAVDAMGFGNPIIVPNHGAFKDYGGSNLLRVSGIESTVFGVTDSVAGFYTSDENWFNVNIRDFSNLMLNLYENKSIITTEMRDRITRNVVESFSREVVGGKLKEAIYAE